MRMDVTLAASVESDLDRFSEEKNLSMSLAARIFNTELNSQVI